MIGPIENDLALLRALVARELDTINSYRRLAAECEDPATIEFFTHVVDEEKFHVADALRAIALLDEDQADLLQAGFAAGHVPGHVPAVGVGRATATASDAASRSQGRIDPEFGDVPSILNSSEAAVSVVDSRTESRVPSTWTVGSLRGVPQHE